MKKAILNRINKINDMISEIKTLDETPSTYDGGTWPFYIDINSIKVKNQFVYIDENKGVYAIGFEKRYNVNNEGQLDELKYDLSVIKRAFNQSIKNN